MVQATILLVATALTVTVLPTVDVPTCEQVREQAKQYSMREIRAMAKRARLTAEQWAAVRECLGDKK